MTTRDTEGGSGKKGREHEERTEGEPPANVRSDVHGTQTQPDTPETMQRDHEDAVGRQRYADARPGDYSTDFQEDDSGAHPVKPVPEDAVDEDGIPKIARTEPPEKEG